MECSANRAPVEGDQKRASPSTPLHRLPFTDTISESGKGSAPVKGADGLGISTPRGFAPLPFHYTRLNLGHIRPLKWIDAGT